MGLSLDEVALTEPEVDEARVKVLYFSLNWVDMDLMAGNYTVSLESLPARIEEGMSDGEAITAVTGTFIVSAVLMSDFVRFVKKDSDIITASFLPFFMCATLGYIVAAVVAVLLHSSDLLQSMLALGLGSGALFLIFLSAWIANVINRYSCSLNMASVFVIFK